MVWLPSIAGSIRPRKPSRQPMNSASIRLSADVRWSGIELGEHRLPALLEHRAFSRRSASSVSHPMLCRMRSSTAATPIPIPIVASPRAPTARTRRTTSSRPSGLHGSEEGGEIGVCDGGCFFDRHPVAVQPNGHWFFRTRRVEAAQCCVMWGEGTAGV